MRWAAARSVRACHSAGVHSSREEVLRVARLAHIDLTEAETAALPAQLEFEDRGMHSLKGIDGEWRLFAYVED